jgi:hypothetical protein
MAEKKEETESKDKSERKFNWFPKFTFKRAQTAARQILGSDAIVRDDLMKVFGIPANNQTYLFTVWLSPEDAMQALNKLRYKVFHRLLLHPYDWMDFKLSLNDYTLEVGTTTLPAMHRCNIRRCEWWDQYTANPFNVYWHFSWLCADATGKFVYESMSFLFPSLPRSTFNLPRGVGTTEWPVTRMARSLIAQHAAKRTCWGCLQELPRKKAWKCRVAVFCSWTCFLHNQRNEKHNAQCCLVIHVVARCDALKARENSEVD